MSNTNIEIYVQCIRGRDAVVEVMIKDYKKN